MRPFILETSRLIIRAFQPADLHAIQRILDLTFGAGTKITDEAALNERREWLDWSRLSATTEYDNTASIGVMRKPGMTIAKNPLPDPPWLQVVGILDQPASKESARG